MIERERIRARAGGLVKQNPRVKVRGNYSFYLVVIGFVLPVLLSFRIATSISNVEKSSEHAVDSVVVSYLSWNLKTRRRLSCLDVKDYNNGRNDKFVIKDDKVIQALLKSLSLVELTFVMKKEECDIRMVLDFYVDGEIKKELCLPDNGYVCSGGNL